MKHLAILFLSLVVLTGSARADFQTGMDAYEKEDYAAALKEWRPLAEAGFPDSQRLILQGKMVTRKQKPVKTTSLKK